MCGLTGFLWRGQLTKDFVVGQLNSMTEAIKHRGPDDDGAWVNSDDRIAIGHRRLSILDLSTSGHQPMVSKSKQYTIAFNGEIYNHLELREKLSKSSLISFGWNGCSDTETLLMCFDIWGIEETLKKIVGMFAIALYDNKEKSFYLVRDRMGEKPLYYGWNNGAFLFGSELKSLKSFSKFSREVDRDALALYLKYDYIPAPYSIYRGINKLPPGSFIKIKMIDNQWKSNFIPEPVYYWSMNEVVSIKQHTDSLVRNDENLIEEADCLLSKSVKQQMISDVPLGAFLSGGIDSSVVVALMQKQAEERVKTFTIGFSEEHYNEAEYAKAVANHLGTEHTELYVSPEQTINVIPQLPEIYDEPFADSSQIPTFLVSKVAQEHVTVALSGDGGDEFFGGYNRYFMANKVWKNIEKISPIMRRGLSKSITTISPKVWNKIISGASKVLPDSLNMTHPGDKMYKLADMLCSQDIDDVYDGLVSHWKNPTKVVIGCENKKNNLLDRLDETLSFNYPEYKMMYLDAVSYLPDDILVKVDRASMATSLETRAPFLDHNVVEFAWGLPFDMKIRDNKGKWVLRQVLNKYIPRKLIDRPKMGFGVPIDSWLRGPLREWAENLLGESRLREEGYFHPDAIREKWLEHLSGQRNWQYHLWSILMFQVWLENENV